MRSHTQNAHDRKDYVDDVHIGARDNLDWSVYVYI